jgi:DNA repair protein RecN (Recombination protein N)
VLRELRIFNLAIIDELHLSFAPGFNVLTGETGAGKSIITRAIGLLCGDRSSADLVRTDTDEAIVEGVLEIGNPTALSDSGFRPAEDVLVRRIIGRTAKGRTYVNGSLATTGVLAQLGEQLIHLYGQHEQALLLRPESHLSFLDEFGRHHVLCASMTGAYGAARAAADRLAALVADGDRARQRLDLLRFQVSELTDAKLARGEEAELQQERELQRHAERLLQICQQCEDALYSGDGAVTGVLGRALHHLQDAARVDPGFGITVDLLRQAATHVEEVAGELRRSLNRIRHDPQRLEAIEERLQLLSRLKRKYGCEADDLVDRLQAFESDLTALEHESVDVAATRRTADELAGRAWQAARALSQARHRAAAELPEQITPELVALGMRGARFEVRFSAMPPGAAAEPATLDGLTAQGADTLQFYLSANPGEEPRPLARIASGGELSRIMLALKTLTAGAGEVPTLIFDEVDAGIGGTVAEAVGTRLRSLARTRQVLCITHLPQIAAQADQHLAIEKRVDRGRTTTTARILDRAQRIRELTRMLGDTVSPESLQYARRLLNGAAKSAAN